eukprot:Opistho-2@38951
MAGTLQPMRALARAMLDTAPSRGRTEKRLRLFRSSAPRVRRAAVENAKSQLGNYLTAIRDACFLSAPVDFRNSVTLAADIERCRAELASLASSGNGNTSASRAPPASASTRSTSARRLRGNKGPLMTAEHVHALTRQTPPKAVRSAAVSRAALQRVAQDRLPLPGQGRSLTMAELAAAIRETP